MLARLRRWWRGPIPAPQRKVVRAPGPEAVGHQHSWDRAPIKVQEQWFRHRCRVPGCTETFDHAGNWED